MDNIARQNIELWARDLYMERRESIDYFLKFGSPVEKALVKKVVELAEAKA